MRSEDLMALPRVLKDDQSDDVEKIKVILFSILTHKFTENLWTPDGGGDDDDDDVICSHPQHTFR
jgi:hypothetical protein